MKNSRRHLALLAIVVMTAAWGSTFFMIKDVVTRVEVTDLLTLRFGIAAAFMTVVAFRHLRMNRTTLIRGLALGVLYGVAQILQTVGLTHTAASVSGFITGLYVVATPLLAALIFRVHVSGVTWIAVGLATGGLGVLSLHGFTVGYGEFVTLLSAVVYAAHIIAVGRWSTRETTISLTIVQMYAITAVCGIATLFPGGSSPHRGIQLPTLGSDWLIIVYLAVIAGALTMFLQTWAQARIEPTRAAVIMAMEPVWAATFAVALGNEKITWRMLVGGLAILAAMYLVELAPRRRRPKTPNTPTEVETV